MDTAVCPVSEAAVQRAAALLKAGQVVAIPTETVYGLAASAYSGAAVRRIFEAKGRPQDNPLIAHIAGLDMLRGLAAGVPRAAYALAEAFWPGPLTVILPRGPLVADEVCAGLGTVGVRMPAHPVARDVIRESGVPLAAPSANLSGSPSPTTAAHVLADMDGRVSLIIDGGQSAVGVESTVVSLVGRPTVLRPGYVTPAQLGEVLGAPVGVAGAVTAPLAAGQKPESPGMKYRHYAPRAAILLVHGGQKAYIEYVNAHAAPGVWALCFAEDVPALQVPCVPYGGANNPQSQAAGLFVALRKLDELGAKTAYAAMPQTGGVGLAVYNRLLRAAAFRVIEV